MNAAVENTQCPADETLAAFIDGRLGPEARQPVIEHIAECAECRDVLNTADELAQESGAAVVPMPRRSWLVPAASLAAAAAIGFVLYTGPLGERYRTPRRAAELAAAAKTELAERPIPGRLSIDFGYKVYDPPRGGESETPLHRSLAEVGADIERAARKNPTPANLHQLGLAYLLLNYSDVAIEYLQQAVTTETGRTTLDEAIGASKNPDLLNDLAAVLHARGDDDRARAAITRAWSLKKSPAVAWTRATILGTREAWNDYLALDATSEWAARAKEELDQIGN